ncbi:hypothetical protein Tco_1100173 [Tanacetum coccineum]
MDIAIDQRERLTNLEWPSGSASLIAGYKRGQAAHPLRHEAAICGVSTYLESLYMVIYDIVMEVSIYMCGGYDSALEALECYADALRDLSLWFIASLGGSIIAGYDLIGGWSVVELGFSMLSVSECIKDIEGMCSFGWAANLAPG